LPAPSSGLAHRWMIFSIAYLLVRRLLGCLALLAPA
jgi:hypothetical protein